MPRVRFFTHRCCCEEVPRSAEKEMRTDQGGVDFVGEWDWDVNRHIVCTVLSVSDFVC